MKSDSQLELEKLLSTLEPWQQQWVACRAAMRTLPAIGATGGFRIWEHSQNAVLASARLPWFVSLTRLVEIDDHKDIASVFALSVGSSYAAYAKKSATPVYAAAYAIIYAATQKNSEAILASTSVVEAVEHNAGLTIRLFIAATIADTNWFASQEPANHDDENTDVWRRFFGRSLWTPNEPWPDRWQAVIARFRNALAKVKLSYLADQYEEHCREGADFEDIQRWLFGEVRIPLHREDRIELPESDVWWMQLLYRMGLEDRGRLNVLVQPRVDDVEAALRELLSSPAHRLKRRQVADVAERLEKQFGHLSPPPLWTAWFQAVHGDELRKIRERFAKEPH